jgi:NAD(P)-dependent dehydrogenase (short-subunit alcohol dehydrogenase family)
MNIHVKGTFLCHQAAALQMKEQGSGGCLLSTVSAAHFGNFGQVNYAGAKGAIASMTYTMAMELARYGIRANAISPSGTTRMSDTYVGPDGKKHPMPYIDPELNGPVLIYLCSDEGNYISGQIFGTGGERISLLSQPRYGHTLLMPGGWTIEEVQKSFKSNLGNRLEPLGITKPPYPFYDGVNPPEAK